MIDPDVPSVEEVKAQVEVIKQHQRAEVERWRMRPVAYDFRAHPENMVTLPPEATQPVSRGIIDEVDARIDFGIEN